MWDASVWAAGASVVAAGAAVLGIWLSVRREIRGQQTNRDERLELLEASVEDQIRTHEGVDQQRHEENLGNFAEIRQENQENFNELKDKLTESIHQIQLSLARHGINGKPKSPIRSGPG